jgi:hypothetical protein
MHSSARHVAHGECPERVAGSSRADHQVGMLQSLRFLARHRPDGRWLK